MAHRGLPVFDLSVMDHCISISAAEPYDDEDPYETYISIPAAQVNQEELQRLYLTHPWTWSHPACTQHGQDSSRDALLVATEWDRATDDPQEDHLAQDYMVMYSYHDDGMNWWIRNSAVPQVHAPDNVNTLGGLEGVRVVVDVDSRRLVMIDFLPFYTPYMDGKRQRRKKRNGTVKIPGIKML